MQKIPIEDWLSKHLHSMINNSGSKAIWKKYLDYPILVATKTTRQKVGYRKGNGESCICGCGHILNPVPRSGPSLQDIEEL